MKQYSVAHTTPEWFALRRGMPTSSNFGKIITPAKGDYSAQAASYMHLLIAEIITGESHDKFPPSYWMERGALMEAEAASLYEFETGLRLEPGGFITDDAGRFGASPDRLVYDGQTLVGALEIKCPAPWTHVENLLKADIDRAYVPQVQGQMLLGGFEFVDWYSYHPQMPSVTIRTRRDDAYMAKLAAALDRFYGDMQAALDRLVAMGALAEMPPKAMPEDDPIAAMLAGAAFDSTISAG